MKVEHVHEPVLVNEVLTYLDPKENENFIDGTVGEAGHAKKILEKNGPNGQLLGIDWDQDQVENSRKALVDFRDRITIVHDSYANVADIVEREEFGPVHGMLVDVGMSSWQLEGSEKGFSFQKDQLLDMRYSLENPLTAEEIVNRWPEAELERILIEYGEEKFARKIASEIVKTRNKQEIKSTFELKEIIERAVPGKFQHGRIHPATRTFQALRIAVNGELENLEKFLGESLNILVSGGRLAVISFHSLEDRIVKHFFKQKEQEQLVTIVTKKPVEATEEEIAKNPRARSAKLRVIIKT